MTELKCEICAAELLPGTGFCRQCGAAISATGAGGTSESPTAIFPPHDSATTQRLQARPTRREQTGTKPSALRPKIFLLVSVIVLLLGGIAAVAVLSDKTFDGAVPKEALLYPGATTVIDLDHSDGGHTIHLQTPDPLDRVERWYQNSLDLDKTLRLTSSSVVMKNAKVAITLATEDNKTNILIKQAP
ncbi:MAG TPA: hypothetical protein VJV03_00665 [Pyrinomonadaceae bacterium]|nr:hypothetical protein [Pyrinomonadaceae bacterium]